MSKKVRRQAIGVALFPFLAVLICTMGALIVLLVLLVQQASLDAQEIVKERARSQQPAADPLAAERKAAQEKIEDEEWRRGILEGQRTERAEELAAARLKAAHLADHIRRLTEQAQALMARATEIDRGEKSKTPDLTTEQNELNKLQAEIARRKAELEAKKKELAAKEKSYALIPYDGPNGTKRRPIYIECTRHGVVLHPEGLILGPDDFNGPLNPGNPLDAGIRAIREAWIRSGEPGEPYPLLVVRPDGIVAYQYARQALRGYDEEFGYELVGADKKLDYGTPNPAMQRVLEQVVGSARQRQVMLAAAMPKKFKGEDTVVSFAAEDQPSFQEAVAAAGGGNGPGYGAPGNGGQSGNQPGGIGNGGNGGVGLGSGNNNFPGINTQFSAASNSIAAQRAGQGSGAANGSNIGSNGTSGAYAAGNRGGAGGTPGQPGSQAGVPGGNSAVGGTDGNIGASPPGAGQQAMAVQSGAPRPGQGEFIGNQNGAAAAASAAGQGSGNSTASGGQQGGTESNPSGAPASSANAQKTKNAQPARNGSNWGLPGSFGKTTAVTRPMRIVCLPDRFVVVPDKGDDRAASVIAISPQVQPAEVDALVTAVQKRLTSWGPAMTNGYWKPVLQVEVSRGAETQFETLQILLQGSGFEIQRKAPQ